MPLYSVTERIRQYNAGRRADTLALKYSKLRKSPFSFFRGTAHLFYQSAAPPAAVTGAPLASLCGDLHLENFGAYRGDNGLACFSVNDFDEALVGPVTWDLARLVASLFVGPANLFVGPSSLPRSQVDAKALSEDFLLAYAKALAAGGARLADAAGLSGPIGAIVGAFPNRVAPEFLDEHSDVTPAGRRLVIDGKRFLHIDAAERVEAIRRLDAFAQQNPSAGPFRVLDVARLVAGTSSLGLDRYAVLTEGEGAVGASRLVELKEARGSCAAPYLNHQQLGWPSQAERVVAAQRLFPDVPPALLGAVGDAAKSFIVRDYSRASDRLSLDEPGLVATVHTLAQIVAAGHWRGSAAEGAAGAAALQAFAREPGWQAELIAFAHTCAAQSQADYAEYCQAYDRGELAVQ